MGEEVGSDLGSSERSTFSREVEIACKEACSRSERARLAKASCCEAAGEGLERGSEEMGKSWLIAT